MASAYHIFLYETGETWTEQITWKVNGTAKNLTGYTASMTLTGETGVVVATLTTAAGGGIVITPATGQIAITIPQATVDVMGDVNYELMLFDVSLNSKKLLRGKMSAIQGESV